MISFKHKLLAGAVLPALLLADLPAVAQGLPDQPIVVAQEGNLTPEELLKLQFRKKREEGDKRGEDGQRGEAPGRRDDRRGDAERERPAAGDREKPAKPRRDRDERRDDQPAAEERPAREPSAEPRPRRDREQRGEEQPGADAERPARQPPAEPRPRRDREQRAGEEQPPVDVERPVRQPSAEPRPRRDREQRAGDEPGAGEERPLREPSADRRPRRDGDRRPEPLDDRDPDVGADRDLPGGNAVNDDDRSGERAEDRRNRLRDRLRNDDRGGPLAPDAEGNRGNGERDEEIDALRDRREERQDDRRARDRREERAENLSDIRRERRERRNDDAVIFDEGDGRRIITRDGRMIIRSNDLDRLRGDRGDLREERDGDRIRTIVVRPDGSRIITITDLDGNVIRRVREVDGETYVLFDNSRFYRERRNPTILDFFVDVAPPRITIPDDEYVVEADLAPPDVIYDTFAAPPVVRVDRRYSLDQVVNTPALLDRVRRVDIDTVTFESGSSRVSEDQIGALDTIADAILRVLKDNPNDVFLIEGHTDAVGSDIDNLSLSDRRAEEVAYLLSEYYDVPAENLTTKGYGEAYLKVQTDGPSRQNRRVTMRNITGLIETSQAQ